MSGGLICPQSHSGRYRAAGERLVEGVRVHRASGEFHKAERETALAFIKTEPLMEINTCHRTWHRRLDNDGARPESILVAGGAAAKATGEVWETIVIVSHIP